MAACGLAARPPAPATTGAGGSGAGTGGSAAPPAPTPQQAENEYWPDYAVPPGLVLGERLEAHGISQAEFARRCGRSAKLISEIIAGKAPIGPRTAVEFERVLGVDANIWLGIEKDYRLHQTRAAEADEVKRASAWARQEDEVFNRRRTTEDR